MKVRKFLHSKRNESAPTILIEGAVTPLSSSSDVMPLKVASTGELMISGSISLDTSDIQIGSVELKDGTTDQRATINSDGNLKVIPKYITLPYAEYKSPTDFTATYLSNTTITLGTLPITISDDSQIKYISVVSSGSVANSYIQSFDNVGITVSASILTITGSGNVFNSGDAYEIGINEQKKGFDLSTNANMSTIINPISAKYTDPETLISEQDLTDAYADLGSEINMEGYNRLGVFVKSDVNDSENVYLKVLGKHTSGSADEYEIDGTSVKTLWTSGSDDLKYYYEFDIGTLPIVQLQGYAVTTGSTEGDISITINKK